ncbi:hypothetical protein AYO21_04506 [Fonsecaea monophora]|uniref:Uncharacterized protein n=1 Tax=Fonsecaea monophora TaxID=254056 RepID=A0A177FAN8_9EURO|nr:hypothetical protein AYO21_04506 [Fonsecaea monophora]OAG41343.1 hypothetical protein AYO21_04506 [Fonsecaea monophora]
MDYLHDNNTRLLSSTRHYRREPFEMRPPGEHLTAQSTPVDLEQSRLRSEASRDMTAASSPSDRNQELEAAVCRVQGSLASCFVEPYSWVRFKLTPATYRQLVEFFSDNKSFDTLRKFYSFFEQEFAMGLETRLHAVFSQMIAIEILNQLRASQHPFIHEFVKNIESTASAANTLSFHGYAEMATEKDPKGDAKKELECNKGPDSSLHHESARFPGIVIEVAHSQRKEDLPILAEEYIVGSKGSIRCVIGFKFPYPTGKQATVSVWRSKFTPSGTGKVKLAVEQIVKEEVFCDKNGVPNTDFSGLCLSLEYLAPTRAIAEQINDLPGHLTKVQITPSQLCTYFERALRHQNSSEQGVDFVDDEVELPQLQHPRYPSPEEVSGARLRQFEEEEKREELRQEQEDSEYRED